MSELNEGTVIGLGLRDGTYYVAVEPPLTTDEIVALAEDGILYRSEVEVVGSDPGCSFIEVDGGEDIAMLQIMGVMQILMQRRNERIDAYAAVVELKEPQATPFH
jgi:hypothetical protein